MSAGFVLITVINWEKYNPRSDRRHHSWFRMQNDIATDAKLFGLTAAQKFVCICLFAEVSRSGGKQTGIRLKYFSHVAGVTDSEVLDTIKHLADNGVITVESGNHPTPTGNQLTPTLFVTNTIGALRTNERTNVTYDTNERTKNLSPGVPPSQCETEKVKKPKKKEADPLAKETWSAYAAAYTKQYPAAGEPVRNAMVNGQISQFVKRLGEEAPRVAEFYLQHHDQFYIRNLHPVGIMLRDAEKLRGEWKMGKAITGSDAKGAERRTNNRNAFQAAFETLKERHENGKT